MKVFDTLMDLLEVETDNAVEPCADSSPLVIEDEQPTPATFDQIEEKVIAAGADVQDFIQWLDDNEVIDNITNGKEGGDLP